MNTQSTPRGSYTNTRGNHTRSKKFNGKWLITKHFHIAGSGRLCDAMRACVQHRMLYRTQECTIVLHYIVSLLVYLNTTIVLHSIVNKKINLVLLGRLGSSDITTTFAFFSLLAG